MKNNVNQRKVKIISEIHPQHFGSMSEIKRMIMQCKLAGCDYVKVQLYDSEKLFANKDRTYLEINKREFKEIKTFSDNLGIETFASIFDNERLEWCEELSIKLYKIASRTVKEDINLCKKIISTDKLVIISLGMYDYKNKGVPFKNSNVKYLYCVSKYPANLTDINMPDFENSFFSGFSDHTVGIAASLYAISRGAEFIEKHYSNNKSINIKTQLGHVGSMNFDDLQKIRELADSLTLLKANKN
ncbi:MAG: hypothetical protein CMN79_03410 [Spirochaetales bacterium]|jgi:sialic acid synthase SpsE|nr:hypothetical protein [Spirochaetales bacterium]|tara:strand:- start:2805 stop:3536 length:732 start_codon:yes stop_codon:yes gene_type:complete